MVNMFDYRRGLAELGPALSDAFSRVLDSGALVLGPETTAFEREFAQWAGARHCVAVSSGTAALYLALRALDLGTGKRVVTVANTCSPTVAAIREAGAEPVFVDVDPDTLMMAPDALAAALADGAHAVMPVHLWGNAVDLDAVLAVAADHAVPVIEDCAQAAGTRYRDRQVGTWGALGCFSFYPTKNLGAYGDAGAILTDDEALAERLRGLRMYGYGDATVSDFEGTNARINELQAALLRVKLPHLERWNRRRREIAHRYSESLRDLGFPAVTSHARHVYHQFVVRCADRSSVTNRLDAGQIGWGIHYPVPVHRMPAYERFGRSLPVTEKAAEEILSLPVHEFLTDGEIERVIAAVNGERVPEAVEPEPPEGLRSEAERRLAALGGLGDALKRTAVSLERALADEAKQRERLVDQLSRSRAVIARLEDDLRTLLGTRAWRVGERLTSIAGRLAGMPASGLQARIDKRLRQVRALGDEASPDAPSRLKRHLTALQQDLRRLDRAIRPERDTRKLTIAVLAWDLGHNPAGRAFMLAEALSRSFHVLLVGPQFPRFGKALWEPLQGNTAVTVIELPGLGTGSLLAAYRALARRLDADIILASKPRLPSVALGILAKAAHPRPLIVDIDDHELSFFPESEPLPLDTPLEGLEEFEEPYQGGWTRLTETLARKAADRILVSNQALEEKFGGTIVPHARDEERFQPDRYDREEERRRLGLAVDGRVVLFLGTPRPHKGLREVLDAVLALDEPDVTLCVIGDFVDPSFRAELKERGGDRLVLIGNRPFAELPRNLAVADVICLLQDATSGISRYQLPAKLIDAIAMAVPVLATPTPPIQPLLDQELAIATSKATITADLRRVMSELEAHRQQARSAREAFVAGYSYAAINATMSRVVMDALRDPQPVAEECVKVLEEAALREEKPTDRPAGLHLVFLWKQNDAGLYGRRVDMLARYALLDPRVASVAIFDAPTEYSRLLRFEKAGPTTQFPVLARNIWRKRWGLADREGLTMHSFVSRPNGGNHPDAAWDWPELDAFPDFVRAELERLGRRPQDCVFVAYPSDHLGTDHRPGRHLEAVLDSLRPGLLVADVVDDQRTWPGLSQRQVEELTASYRRVLEQAAIVLANCPPMVEALAEFGVDAVLLPNAAEAPDQLAGRNRTARKLAALDGPIVGYVGNLEPSKFDQELLRNLAEQRPDYTFVLIGSTHMNPGIVEAFSELPNVRLLGVIAYDDLDAYIRRFDCALIPHLDTAQTRRMNPLKAYVYAAAGVPIVSTPVENLAELPEGLLHVAEDAETFLDHIDRAIQAEERPSGELPRELGWPKRLERLLSLVEQALGQGASRSRSAPR